MSLEDHQVNQYHLTILAVKMKVKFPCKMKIQHSSNTITQEVQASQQSKFIFNQQVAIQQQGDKTFFDFNIILITQKGAKYVSGVIKLYHNQLEKSQGQKIICPLIKCLDNQAFCELKINKVKGSKVQKRVSVSSTLIQLKRLNSNNERNNINQEKMVVSPKVKKTSAIQTRSQFGFGGLNGKTNPDWDDTRSKGAAQTLIYKNTFLKSPKTKRTYGVVSPKSKVIPDFNQQYENVSLRQKLSSESQVYKEGYQKLKQKYKKQTQSLKSQQTKRMQLEANQNNYKIEIMRLKLKTEEQQRIITQKNEKINQLQITISEINKQQLDMSYLKQQNKNLQQKILMLTDSINSLKKENQVIKKLNQDRAQTDKQIINELRLQIQSIKSKLDNYSLQTSQNLKQKTQQILSLTSEIKSKSSTIQLQKSQIQKLQCHIQNKIYDFEKTLQQQKNTSTQNLNQLKQKLDLLERQKKGQQKQIADLKSEKQKIKSLILKAEYDKKILLQQQKTIKTQLLEFKSLKQKHGELTRQINFFIQDKSNLQKQLQSINESKQINLQQINEQFEIKLNYYKKQSKQFEQRNKNLNSNKIQLQSQMEVAKNSIDKQKRQIEGLMSQIQDSKNSIKELKQYSNLLEQQHLGLQNQVSLINNKLRFGQQTSRLQVQKYRTDLERTKNQLAAQNAKAVLLFQTKSNLQIQQNKNKIQIQYHQDKIDKLFSSNKQYQNNIQYMMKQHESQVNQLQQTILRCQNELKKCHQELHKGELQKISFIEKVQSAKKEQKISEQKISHYQSQLKNRIQEINNLEDKNRNQEKNLGSLENQHSLLRHEHAVLKKEKAKEEKIVELKNQEIETLKKDLKRVGEEKQNLQKIENELREQIKKNNESNTKLQIKLKSSNREHNNFKDLMNKTIKNEFSKLPLLNAIPNIESTQINKDSSPSKSSQESKVTVQFGQLNNNIQSIIHQTLNTALIHSALTSSINQSKTTLFKLIEHNKQLKKQIQNLRQQSQNSSNKYQFTQIQLHRDIQQLQEQLNHLYDQKQQEQINTDKLISDLNTKIHQKQSLCQELSQQIQELQYALSALKLQFQNNNTKNDKKVSILKTTIQQLQEKIQYFKISLSNQQDTNHQLEEKYEILKSQKDELLQLSLKNKVMIEDLSHQKEKLQASLQQTVREKKSLLQKFNQIQIQLNEERDLKNKNKQLQVEQQKKSLQLKEFVSTLMKQKQNIIKCELQKTDKILELETLQIQLKRDLELNAEDLQRIKSQLEEVKEKYRKQNSTAKNLEKELSESVSKNKKSVQKLQQKQKQIQMKDEIIARLDKKYKELAQKNYKQTLQLHSQIDSKYSQNINITKELNQKIVVLQARIQELQHTKAKQHHQYVILSDQLLAQKQHSQLLKRQINKLQTELQEINDEFKSLQKRNEQLTQQIQQRQEQLSQLNDKIIVLEGQLEAISKDKVLKLEEINNDWQRKYENIIEQYEQKLSILQNERQMIRSQLQQKINELELSVNQNKNSQLGITDIKRNYEQKIKKLQADRLNTILSKNNEIKKLSQQNKVSNENIKKLELAQKQNSQLLQNIRKRLINEEKLRKQYDEKIKTQKKIHEAQITSLLTKEAKNKLEKEQTYQSIYSNEREVRKVLQNYLKKILDQCDNNHIDKITNSSKGLQTEVIKAMTNKLSTSS